MAQLFKLKSVNKPAGDQPVAISALVEGLEKGLSRQTLLGVTGSGKTFTIANVIQAVQRPTLVIAHNKTLAAQLCNEFRELFPDNAVHYFVSYYDYYQPEAYMPTSDTYIAKEAMINDEIDRLRHAATTALLTRKDVIVVASVSCIYGLGAPAEYAANILHFKMGEPLDRAALSRKLISLHFTRTTADLRRGTFRLIGDQWEIMPPDRELIYVIETKKGIIKKIYEVNPVEGFMAGKTPEVEEAVIAPAKHYVTNAPERARAIVEIQKELKAQLTIFEKEKKFLEAERLERRTNFDIAMMREIGYCNGIENYSRVLSGRDAGAPPETLLEYFPKDFLTVIDESHVAVSQIGGMYAGDAARKKTLIEYGFRLPSAADNRPLTFEEFKERVGQVIFTSATPSKYEYEVSDKIVEQIIRPTGLVDPKTTVLPARGQIEDLIPRMDARIAKKERILVTTLTKKMAEDLSIYLEEKNYKAAYLHSDIKTLDRVRILTALRRGEYDILVGVNLLREGLDLPEVSLVAILDADKEGFLRSETSLIQTIGRAARHVDGEVLLYADKMTGSLTRALSETARRREIQLAYNKKHGITPRTVVRAIRDMMPAAATLALEAAPVMGSKTGLAKLIKEKERGMREAAGELNFELATLLREEIKLLKKKAEKEV
ncbi:MAG: excinuclease ABC subunit UvrB [bacterium]|nr:excinuclease ABC subunit UvrB [bacterium]